MDIIRVYINDVEVKATKESSVLEEARRNNIYIPSLCYHPDLPPPSKAKATTKIYRGDEEVVGDESEKEFEGCNLCLVEVDGQPDLVRACNTTVTDGMRVYTDTERVLEARREKLMFILAKHPHACLICAQKEGCTREPCPTKVPVAERCCPKLGNCELERVAEYIGIREDTPRFIHANLPVVRGEPLFTRDLNLCIGCTRCVRACQELSGVQALGFVYCNGEVFVGTIAPTLRESACKFCGACVEVCPTGALMDKEVIVGDREESLRLQISQPPLPPEKWLTFEAENIEKVPETEGVYQLLDENKLVVYIKGTLNIRKELEEQLATNPKVSYFLYEEAKMFTMRESELLQKFLKRYGKLPEQSIGLEEDLY